MKKMTNNTKSKIFQIPNTFGGNSIISFFWKNYLPNNNQWEPVKHFEKTPNFVTLFHEKHPFKPGFLKRKTQKI